MAEPNKMLVLARPSTIGDLRASGYRPLSVREEVRKNLIAGIRSGATLFPGIVGFDDTVIPPVGERHPRRAGLHHSRGARAGEVAHHQAAHIAPRRRGPVHSRL